MQGLASRNHQFDVLRGFAILGVILVHTVQSFRTGFAKVDAALELGRFGVQLFYFVSAMTMCFIWDARSQDPDRTKKFYLRRLIRIVPLFYLVLGLYLLVRVANGAPLPTPATLIACLTFVFGFGNTGEVLVPGGWTIAIEVIFYAFFPFIATRVRGAAGALLSAAAVNIAYLAAIRPLMQRILDAHYGVDTAVIYRDVYFQTFFAQAHIFLLGIFAYRVITKPPTRTAIGIFMAIGLIWVAAVVAIPSDFTGASFGLGFLSVVFAELALVLIVIRVRLSSAIIEHLGRLSYSIYFIHFALISILAILFDAIGVGHTGPGALAVALPAVLMGSYLLGILSGRWVERPLHHLATKATALLTHRSKGSASG